MHRYDFPISYIKSVEAGSAFHKTHKTWAGKGTLQYKQYIKDIVDRHKVKTVLDFGCGKGLQYSKYKLDQELNFTVTMYDPCIHGLENWPKGNYDLVLALDCISLIDVKDYQWIYTEFDKWANNSIFIATQIGNIGKTDKQISASNVQILKSENDLILKDIILRSTNKFYIMNNHRMIYS